MRVVVNGEPREAPTGATLTDLLREFGIDPARVAIELDRRIVKSADWPRTALSDGAEVEIVHFVGGG